MAQEKNTRRAAENRENAAPRRPRRRHSTARSMGLALLYVVCVIGVSILLACVVWMAANDVLALNKEEKEVVVTVTAEDSFDDIVTRLKDEGLIEYEFLFKLFATFTGGEEKVTMGTYTLDTDMDYRALLSGMSINSATKAEVQVTIPEGYTVQQIFALLEEKGVATVEDLNEVAANHDYAFSFLQEIPLGDPNRLEGYLYPDTYTFYTPHTPLYAINKMLVNFDSRVTDDMREQVAQGEYDLRQILTIASLIERETDGDDHEKIASVIYNRLHDTNGGTLGFLQIDATLQYALGEHKDALTQADKEMDSPYNTYKYKGLPPGPIANPGMEAIKAAMEPADTNYFYYALGDDGVHHFFKNYDDHVNFINSQELYKK